MIVLTAYDRLSRSFVAFEHLTRTRVTAYKKCADKKSCQMAVRLVPVAKELMDAAQPDHIADSAAATVPSPPE